MKSRPIIFSGEMVRAILSGRKTQTRRPIDVSKVDHHISGIWECEEEGWGAFNAGHDSYLGTDEVIDFTKLKHPPCDSGDTLWVRETWTNKICGPFMFRGNKRDGSFYDIPSDGSCKCIYRADFLDDEPTTPPVKWRPSIHMPREASRITLRVTGIRVERLQDISEQDAKAEGFCDHPTGIIIPNSRPPQRAEISYVDWFKDLWERINKKRQGLTWNDNPWVWVVEFKRVEK